MERETHDCVGAVTVRPVAVVEAVEAATVEEAAVEAANPNQQNN